MFAGLDRGGSLFGMEIGRADDGDRLQLAFEQLAAARQPREPSGSRHAQFFAGRLRFVRKIIGDRRDIVTAMLGEQPGDPGAACAAAHQAEIDPGIGFRGVHER